MGLEEFNGVFFCSFCFWIALAIVEVDEIGSSVVLAPLSTFRAVSGEVSYFSTLEAGVRCVPCGGRVALEVIRTVSLVSIGVLSSAEVISSIVPPIVPSGWCSVPVYVHRNWGVIHPSRGIG